MPRFAHGPVGRAVVGAAVALGFLVGSLAWAPSVSHACAPAPREGQRVEIAGEEALIVWDARSKTEHFIRRASFRTSSDDFGFLVPTPSQPSLAEAADAVFEQLEELVKPEVVTKKRYRLEPVGFFLGVRSEKAAVASAAGVRVLDTQRVAGLDATVLEADSATALGDWLKKHEYAFRKELVQWLEPYVAAHYKVTAFKIAKGETAAQLGTRAVRMSFSAERPFYPYREPTDQAQLPVDPQGPTDRRLRVFLIASERMNGTLERPGGWPGRPTWAGRLQQAQSLLAGALGPDQIPPSPWLTAFDDRSSPRPGSADLWFARSDDQSELRPPPIVREDVVAIPVPIELVALTVLALVGLGGFLAVRAVRRRA